MPAMPCIRLLIFYWFVDIKGIRFIAKPFIIFGSNAITVFFLSSFFAKIFYTIKIGPESIKNIIWADILQPLFGPWMASLIYALVYIAIWYLVAYLMFKRKIFIKI